MTLRAYGSASLDMGNEVETPPVPFPPDSLVPVTPKRESGEQLRLHAFEMYLGNSDLTLGDIAKELGVSRQYLYATARTQRWAERRAQARGAIYTGDAKMDEVLEQAVVELRLKIPVRLLELDELCGHKNAMVKLNAIKLWFALAKEFSEMGNDGPKSVEVYNDLRDQRQVTIVQEPKDTHDAVEESNEDPRL